MLLSEINTNMRFKNIIREILIFFHLDITKNLEYDRLTKMIMKRIIKKNDNCIDIGCHKGETLDLMLRYAPKGKHFAFEPIPYLYENLKKKYNKKATIFSYALANKEGDSSFQLIKNAPAYSGILARKYKLKNPDIEEINVSLKKLDQLIPKNITIHFIKIDVEGGEFDVLKGAEQTLKKDKPNIIFEFGLGAGDYYGVKPEDIYLFLTKTIELKISRLKDFIKNETSLSLEDFQKDFNTNTEYYFIAHQ